MNYTRIYYRNNTLEATTINLIIVDVDTWSSFTKSNWLLLITFIALTIPLVIFLCIPLLFLIKSKGGIKVKEEIELHHSNKPFTVNA